MEPKEFTVSMSLAMSTAITEAAHPMPDRLTVRMLDLNLKCLTTAADREGVGLKAVQLTMSPSICITDFLIQDILAIYLQELSCLDDSRCHSAHSNAALAFWVTIACDLLFANM